MKAVAFAETKPLPSYLVAFAVGPFEVVDAGKAGANGTPLRIVVPRGAQCAAAWFGFLLACDGGRSTVRDRLGVKVQGSVQDDTGAPVAGDQHVAAALGAGLVGPRRAGSPRPFERFG